MLVSVVRSAAILLVVLGLLALPLGLAELGARAGETKGADMPAAEAEALVDHLAESRYAEKWPLWPGTQELYEGSSPHGAKLTTYVNDKARKAIENQAGAMPPGAIVVKENYSPEGKLAALTVMMKARSGYDPEHKDWFYLKKTPSEGVVASGKVRSCIGCHARKSDNDYLFTGDL